MKRDYDLKNELDDAILIGSSGLPNDALLPITTTNNPNGIISQEIRLIFVSQPKTGLLLFFQYVSGNIIDASTMKRTVNDLKELGVNTKFALSDSVYYNGKNADILYEAGISFISRVGGNHGIFSTTKATLRNSLETKENHVVYNG